MKILLYGINFAPELTGIGKYTGEMADWLAGQGHEVRVVTAPPYYPEWCVGEGYKASRYSGSEKFVEVAGRVTSYRVVRCPLWVPYRPGGIKRLVHLATFAISSLPVMAKQVFWRPDVVWMAAPAMMCAPTTWLTARLSGAKSWIHIQDYEVDAAFDLGLLKGQLIRKLALGLERWMLRRFDVVSSISLRMLGRAREKGVEESKIVFFRNWVDLEAILPKKSCATPDALGIGGAYREVLGISEDAVVALYSGNMGKKQGLEMLPEVAKLCAEASLAHAEASENAREIPKLHFVFCGEGVARVELEQQCAALRNVTLLPLQPLERLGELLTMADIHLLPQRADAADLVMPSKLTGMLASGRPVVVAAGKGTELADAVATCGLVVPPEDVQQMADAVRKLAADPALRVRLGDAGRDYAERQLDRQMVLKGFERDLKRLAKIDVHEPVAVSPGSIHKLGPDAD